MTPILDRVGGTARRVAAGAITTAVLTAGLALVAPAPVRAQEPTEDQAARQAAGWLARELEANDYVMPDFSGSPGSRDFGLTIDAFFVLAAAGVGGDVADRVVERIEQDGWQYTQWSPAHGSSADMGSYAKVALALQVAGKDPTRFDISKDPDHFDQWPAGTTTIDLVQLLRDSMLADGHFGAESNHFDQTLAVLVLARTPQGAPAAGVDYLASLQCTDQDSPNYGGLGFGTPGTTCGNVDGDATGFLLSGLLAAGRTSSDPVVQRALTWMEARQTDDGSFPASWNPGAGNTNSTGLVANAARQVGTPQARAIAARARGYVAGLQVDCGSPFHAGSGPGFARGWMGAIAYHQESYTRGAGSGVSGAESDQWRRASAQAALALGDLPGFSELTTRGMDPSTPAADSCALTGSAPRVIGGAVVGQRLTGVPGRLSPAFEQVGTELVWLRAGAEVGYGSTYVVTPADVGRPLVFRVRAAADGYESAILDSAPVVARKARAAVTATWKTKPSRTKAGVLRIRIAPLEGALAVEDGTVRVQAGRRTQVRVADGTVLSVRIGKLGRGKHRIVVGYRGGTGHTAATTRLTVRVR